MKRRGAFTLIELMIVVTLAVIVLGPLLATVVGVYREFQALAQTLDLKSECQTLAFKVMRQAAANGRYSLDQDNHGVSFPNGDSVRWNGSQLSFLQAHQPERLLSAQVTEFSAVRLRDQLVLTLALRNPGGSLDFRSVYHWSAREGFH